VDRTQRKVDELNKWLTADYGPDLSLASLSGQCLSFSQKQYVYEMCPYGDAHQKEGASSTKLGSWAGLKQREDGLTAMEFTNGVSCWQGPARSLTVICRCGVETVIRSVEEPSRCVYEMVLSTPFVCNAEHASKLQAELDEQLNADNE
jgi:protein kinase C substrate 80K-H